MFIIVWKERNLVQEEGTHLAGVGNGQTLEQCKNWCDTITSCRSIAYDDQFKACWLKDKCVTEKDPANPNKTTYKTYYKPCKKPGICNI